MKYRLFWIFLIILIRCILGWSLTFFYKENQLIRLTGYPNKIYLYNANCIIKISNFIFSTKNFCAQYENHKIRVIGSIDRQVIEGINSNLWLRDAKMDILDEIKKENNLNTRFQKYIDYFRNNLIEIFRKSVPEPEAGLTAGVVLGYKDDIGQNFYDALVKSGTIHIAVASGYNILLVGSTLMSLLFWIMKRQKASLWAIIFMFLYVELAGGEPPVTRAFIMAVLMYTGMSIGRSSVSWWSLALTSFVMLLFDPTLVMNVSFQLSVAASIGLMLLSPWLVKIFKGNKFVNILEGLGIVTTFSTMILTLPIIWLNFGRLSLIGIVSNILILPLVPAMMLLGVGALALPGLFSWPLYAIAHLAVRVIWFLGG